MPPGFTRRAMLDPFNRRRDFAAMRRVPREARVLDHPTRVGVPGGGREEEGMVPV